MKKTLKLIVVMSALFLAASNAWALPVAGDLVKMENFWTVPYQLTDINDKETYLTFCLESEKYFTPGVTYEVISVGDYATGGGGGAVDVIGDKLSSETKWLYAAYMSGVFGKTATAAQQVQNAIWYWEEEKGGVLSDWEYLSSYKFNDSGWTVMAVNISIGGLDNQSQLAGTAPVPEPATILLLGTGLLGLAGVRRRRLKK